MNILIENNCVDLRNMGDVAMLQVAVERLRSRMPEASIQVVTSRPDLLERYCPGTEAVPAKGRSDWFYARNLFGKMHDAVPESVDAALTGLAETIRRRNPRLMHGVLSLKAMAHHRDTSCMDAFLHALLNADMLVVSGGGDINDTFADYTLTLLEVLEVAMRQGTPTFMFGQGIGPLGLPMLRRRCATVLPKVKLIGVREQLTSVPLLESLGMPAQGTCLTGDDAIEMAYARRTHSYGSALGLNIRMAPYSLLDSEVMAQCRDAVKLIATRYGADIVPIPISFYPGESDIDAIAQLAGSGLRMSNMAGISDNPASIMEMVRECRIVITGSYHSAVFALAQGIPAIGIARSQYYRNKFLGLMDQFETQCEVVSVDDDNFPEMLMEAAEKAWDSAEWWRAGLLDAARRQIRAGRVLYDRACQQAETAISVTTGGIEHV